ncbi:MAG: calcium/sodium antiporter [Phycisphaerales bacterium]|nr:calcium/sodium antiporter [Planctomycetota bacterium]MBL6996939.1 calcium/sodium antiporter [Phycisphaerales bacterium]
MDSIITFAQDWYGITLILGVAMLIFGGHMLVEGSVAIATRLGISKLVIGLTIVAFSTSSPELALNVVASINNHGELCLGNIFGSNIANIGLVLGIGALICKLPVTGRIIKVEFPWLIVATVVVGGATLFGVLNSYWAIGFLCLFTVLMWTWFRIGKEEESQLASQSEEAIPEVHCSSIGAWAMLLVGLLLLGFGGKATEVGAVTGALALGMSKIVVGGTVVAIATSLPEVVTTIIAAKKNHPDLAVGNVVGSNIFNILFVLPITMLVKPITVPSDAWMYVVIMVGITLLAWVLTMDQRIKPKEGGILLALYISFLVWVTFVAVS